MNDGWKGRWVKPRREKMASREATSGTRGSVRSQEEPPGWYSRGYLPHFDGGEMAQTVTFRLFDSLPQPLLAQWREELALWPEREAEVENRKRIEAYLDRGLGSAWMNDPRIAAKVEEALLFFDGDRYRLRAWVVMPNHVHALVAPTAGWELGQILHSWKSFTSNECNNLLGRREQFWQKETFDRFVRNEKHYYNAVAYIENNPVKAGLCLRPEAWKWSSARWEK
jgi:REP element-mobilizing transposase RayT